MPIYEYECASCHHCFDVIQKMNDAPITLCPVCSKETVTKLISAAGFQLKGTGWYETDFKNKGKPPVTSTTDAKSNTSTPSESKADSSKPTESVTKESTPKTTTSTVDK